MNRTMTSALALILAGAPGAAMAATTDVSGSITLPSGTTTYDNSDASNYNYGAPGRDLYAYEQDGASRGFIHSWVFENGVLGTRSDGEGTYGVSTGLQLINTYSATAGNLIGNFHFNPIQVAADATGSSAVNSSGGFGFTIARDGTIYASLSITAVASNNGIATDDVVTTVFSGFDLADLNLSAASEGDGFASIFGSGGYVSIDLGMFAGGDFDIDYQMFSSAAGATNLGQGENCGYGYGATTGDFDALAVGYGGRCANAIGRSGDPFSFDSGYDTDDFFDSMGAPNSVQFNLAAVPEPAALGLLGVGLAGMGLARRRRK